MLRPSTALRATRALRTTPVSSCIRLAAAKSFSSSSACRAADHAHEDHYDPPGGWLFGVKPGETKEKEGWEGVWVWGFFGGLGLAVVAYAFKPDTS